MAINIPPQRGVSPRVSLGSYGHLAACGAAVPRLWDVGLSPKGMFASRGEV